jgi:hypothetical protein
MPLSDVTARGVLEWIGVELDRPLVSQVSRFDPWKDPLGVIEAYRLARRGERCPDCSSRSWVRWHVTIPKGFGLVVSGGV